MAPKYDTTKANIKATSVLMLVYFEYIKYLRSDFDLIYIEFKIIKIF